MEIGKHSNCKSIIIKEEFNITDSYLLPLKNKMLLN